MIRPDDKPCPVCGREKAVSTTAWAWATPNGGKDRCAAYSGERGTLEECAAAALARGHKPR